ncbi:MAG: hypothetical protein ACJA2B_001765 [Candidatus Endobugula sp.]|jgi:hypothetical protein
MLYNINKNIVIALLFLLSPAIYAADTALFEKKTSQLNSQYVELERSSMGYMTKKIELEITRSKLQRLKRSAEAERRTLDRMIEAKKKSPDVDFSDRIDLQRLEWRKINKLYLSQKEYIRILHDKVEQDKIQYKITQQKIVNLQDSVDRMIDKLANEELNRQFKSLRKSQDIEIVIAETCSLSVTKDDCIDKARVLAERDAAERGSLVVIDAVTEVKNFNLTKDEVRSRVSARISNIQVFKKTFDLTEDRTGWRVEYGITATVTPAIHDGMRNQLKLQVTTMFRGKINFRDVQTADLPDIVELPPEVVPEEEEEDVAAYSEPIDIVSEPIDIVSEPIDIVSEPIYTVPDYVAPVNILPAEIVTKKTSQKLRDETEKEMEEIRSIARFKAIKTEAKEARKELDSRTINIMVF